MQALEFNHRRASLSTSLRLVPLPLLGEVKHGTDKHPMTGHRIYAMPFASVYSAYIAKAEKKGRSKAEVDEIIRWMTGLDQKGLEAHLAAETDFQTFFAKVPLNPDRTRITGVVCGVRVEEVAEPLMREIRYLDKLIDELAKGRPMAKILRA